MGHGAWGMEHGAWGMGHGKLEEVFSRSSQENKNRGESIVVQK